MDRKIIAVTVQQISNIMELSGPDGARELDIPYFVDEGGTWLFCMVNERTDAKELIELIKAGRVYIYFDMNKP